jgi:outer membrane protein assembly factor BamD (BamD/ComL family)
MKTTTLLFALVFLTGCAMSSQPEVAETNTESAFQSAASLAKENKYPEAVAAYRKFAAETPVSPLAAEALFQAACLSAASRNPRRDYTQALAYFEEFLKLHPDHEKAVEAENWRAALTTIMNLKRDNARLNQSIERLKRLDITSEERRRK